MIRHRHAAPAAGALLLAVAFAGVAAASAAAADPSFALGEGRVVTSGPRAGTAFSCSAPVRAAAPTAVPWIAGGRWTPARRPRVDGSTAWPGARFTTTRASAAVTFDGNALPSFAATGVFPVAASDDAAPYATASAAIAEHGVSGSFAGSPRAVPRPRCVDSGSPVAISVDGVPVLPPFDVAGRDLFAREVTDRCGGVTDADGLYRRRGASPCLGRRATGREHSGLVGWARDGFPLYGPRGARGVPLRSADLDACHGHAHRVGAGVRKRSLFHYHATPDFPYAIGCFHGAPATGWTIAARRAEPEPDPPAAPPDPPAPPPDPPPPGLGAATVSADPALFPAFDVDVTDYVVRCGGAPVNVSAGAPDGLTVAIDGGAARSGDQAVPVGVEAGQAFALTVANRDQSRTFHVRCLPDDFPAFSVERFGSPQAEWFLVTPSLPAPGGPRAYAAAFDARGVPVWWLASSVRAIDMSLLPNGNFAWAPSTQSTFFGMDDTLAYEERRLDGTLAASHRTVGSPTDPHDLQPLPNGNVLLVTYRPRDHVDLSAHGGPADATVVDSEIQEVEPDGDLAWSWSSKDHIDVAESERWIFAAAQLPDGRTAYDLTHVNSVAPDGDGIVVSLRHTDAVYRIDRATGAVEWKLGGTPTPESLTPVGDPFGAVLFGGQHDARALGDGSVTVHDNGTRRSRGPRALRYRIDTTARTATLLEDVRDAPDADSFCCGGARRLPTGNWVAGWGALRFVGEYAPSGEPVLRIRFDDLFSYRGVPVEPGHLGRAALRAGMDAMNPR